MKTKIPFEMERIECPSCGIIQYLPKNFIEIKRRTHQKFYCPNEHEMSYPVQKDDDPDVLKDKLAKAEAEVARLKTEVLNLRHQLEQAETKKLRSLDEP